jgi:uncharacterized protein DUF6603
VSFTLDALLVELASVFRPLEQRLAAGELAELFVELGLDAPDIVLASAGTVDAAAEAGAAAADLVALIPSLVDAAAAEDLEALAVIGAEVSVTVIRLGASVDALAGAISAAAGAAGPLRAELEAWAAQLPEALAHHLMVTYVEMQRPLLARLLALAGIVDIALIEATATAPAHARRRIHFDRIAQLITEPLELLRSVYGWGEPGLDHALLLDRLRRVIGELGVAVWLDDSPAGQPVLHTHVLTIGPSGNGPAPGLDIDVATTIPGGFDIPVALSDSVTLELGFGVELGAGAAITVVPPADVALGSLGVPLSGSLSVRLIKSQDAPPAPLTLFGITGGPRIEADQVALGAAVELVADPASGGASGAFAVSGEIAGGRVVISLAGADGFLQTVMPGDGITLDFDLRFGWNSASGLFFVGSAGLETEIPVDLMIGPIRVSAFYLRLGVRDQAVVLEASTAISAKLGPFAMAVDRMGVGAKLTFPGRGGNLGVAELGIGFKPPSGIGLVLDAGIVKGGGYLYLDFERGEYAGALELTIGPVSIKALGLLTTKLPDGSGWALLVMLFGQFPPIQLGFGFVFSGVGGVVGVQHTVDIDQLQNGLRTGVLDDILFPADPVADAPRIIGQLRTVFPVTPDKLMFGPVVELGWGSPQIMWIRLGLIVQIDTGADSGLDAITLLGQLRVLVPDGDAAVLRLIIDVLGDLRFADDGFSLLVLAQLRDSRVGLFSLTGSLLIKIVTGRRATFVVSAGGFHPEFRDLPPGLPQLDRVGFGLRQGPVQITVGGYFAVTSNSVQAGARLDVMVSVGATLEAWLGFDALFVFEPRFMFTVTMYAGARISYRGTKLAGIDLRFTLSGPDPWHAWGSAEFSILWWDIEIDFDVTFGEELAAPPLPTADVAGLLATALANTDNWMAHLPADGDMLVTLGAVDIGDHDVLAHPLGDLTVRQKVVPLGLTIDRLGNSRPSGARHFEIGALWLGASRTPVASRVQEHFARGQYLDLTEDEKLAQPSFEHFDAGVRAGTEQITSGPFREVTPDYETWELRQRRLTVNPMRWRAGTTLAEATSSVGAVGRSTVHQQRLSSAYEQPDVRVEVREPRYAAVDVEDLTNTLGYVGAHSEVDQAAAASGRRYEVVEIGEVVG